MQPGLRVVSSRHRTAISIVAVVALVAWSAFAVIAPVRSTPTTVFEITDGDIVDGAAPAAPDWGSIFGRTPTGTAGAPVSVVNPQGTIAPSFVEDLVKASALPSPPCSANKTGDLTVLSGGGSDKNGDALSTWTWGAGNIPPNKDDITNLYGAAAVDPTTSHRILYFGMERSDNNGAGHLDVEFLQAPMGRTVTGSDPATGCPEGSFSGSRTVGDVLMILDLSKGGTLGLQELRVWDGAAYVAPVIPNTTTPLPLAGIAGIAHNETGTVACGDWNCKDSSANVVSSLATNTFVEGYLDLAALQAAMGQTATVASCFAAFNGKSRSSDSWNSELKDIAFGEFNTCDARISISPSGVNPVGTNHTFTAQVDTNASGAFAPAPDGTQISFAIVSGPGSFVNGVSTCATAGGTGSCSVAITSATAGTTVVSASTTAQVGPVQVTRSTNGNAGPGGSGNASKAWVDGYIKVTPTAVNPVNQPHQLTVELGVLRPAGTSVGAPTITPTVTPSPNGGATSTCASPTSTATDVWQCTVTINSSVAGVFTATASGSVTVNGTGTPNQAVVNRSTAGGSHGPGGNNGATKTYVDARISVSPSGLNPVGQAHTVTAAVETKDGTGAWTSAPAGTTVTFSRTGAGGYHTGSSGTCQTAGTTGQCSTAINSAVAGSTTVGATVQVTVNGISLTRTTGTTENTAAGGSGPITKRWVDASVAIAQDGVNPVGQGHQFTITVTAHRPTTESVTFTSITPSVSPTPTSASSTCASPTVAADGLSATCTYTINSNSAGVFDVDAQAVVGFDDGIHQASVTRSTSGTSGPSGNSGATKTYVDARVSVGPDGTNRVGDPHTLTGTAEYNDGTGWKPASGRTITFATTQGPGSFVNGISSCTAGVDGTCTVQIVSATPGVQWVSASTSYSVLGVNLARTTAVTGATDPNNARKEWVDAAISITPSGTNAVGDPHSFTITVTGSSGGTAASISNVARSVNPTPTTATDDCAAATASTANNVTTLTCTLTINSTSAGVFTANASATVTIGSVVVNVATDGTGGSGAAIKTYVDARISVGQSGVNEIGDPHPVTAAVEVNDGTGWASPGAGLQVILGIVSGPGALSGGTCLTTANGTCGVSLTSGAAGVTVVSASTSVDVKKVTLVRSTASNSGPGGSGDLTKRWVDASVSISPSGTNPVGAPHTFTVTATAVPSGAAPVTFAVTPSVTPAPDELTTTCATPVVNGDIATCTVTISNDDAGVFSADATVTVTVGGVAVVRSTDAAVAPAGPGGSGPATKRYVGADLTLVSSGVNEVRDPHVLTGTVFVDPAAGRVPAPDGTTIGFVIQSGPGALSSPSCTTSGSTGACSVTLSSAVAGVTVVGATATLTVQGVTFDLTTNGAGRNSGPITKRWVDAFVTIGPSATNPLDEPHTFDVTVVAVPSGASPVSFVSIVPTVTPTPGALSSTCAQPTISGSSATCTVTINSGTPGQFTAHVTATLDIGGVRVVRSTDGAVAGSGPGGSGPAIKTYERIEVLGVALGPELPRTGAESRAVVMFGAGLVVVGAVLVAGSRRRRPVRR